MENRTYAVGEVNLTVLDNLDRRFGSYRAWLLWKSKSCLKTLVGRRTAGPNEVIASLHRGLRGLAVADRTRCRNAREVWMVPRNLDILKQALRKKAACRQKPLLLAGPNICLHYYDLVRAGAEGGIDVFVHPSAWVLPFWEREGAGFPMEVWPTGVDLTFWKSDAGTARSHFLLYNKNQRQDLCDEVHAWGRKHQIDIVEIKYGHYTTDVYKNALRSARLAIFITNSESQGIAQWEAWSMGVPAVVWETGELTIDGKKIRSSASPYLNPLTGEFWPAREDFASVAARFLENEAKYRPRLWVERHGSDQASAFRLLEIVNKYL